MIIALEGIDGAGKSVQAGLLTEALRGLGHSCLELSFPDYDSFLGKHIGELLSGRGSVDAHSVDPHSMAMWFAVERLQRMRYIDTRVYDYVVLNRYTPSNAVYQSLRLPEGERGDFIRWVFELEYGEFGLPRPHHTIVLDVDEALSARNVSKKGFRAYTGGGPDVYENSDIMNSAREMYRSLVRSEDGFHLVECALNSKMRAPQQVRDTILEILSI